MAAARRSERHMRIGINPARSVPRIRFASVEILVGRTPLHRIVFYSCVLLCDRGVSRGTRFRVASLSQAQAAIDEGYRVITVSTSLTQSGIVKRLKEDFGDISDFNDQGLMQHPRFAGWLEETVAASLQ